MLGYCWLKKPSATVAGVNGIVGADGAVKGCLLKTPCPKPKGMNLRYAGGYVC